MKHPFKIGLLCLSLMAASSAQARDKIKMGTIAPGSTIYDIMTSVATTVNVNQDDYEISVNATGLGTKQMIDVARGRLDMAMATPETFQLMADGQSMFKNLPDAPALSKNLGAIFWFPTGTYHIATQMDSGITSLSDIKGQKVFLGEPGGGEYHVASQYIEAITGFKAGRDYTPVRATWASAMIAFENREIGIYVAPGKPPFSLMRELASNGGIRILGLPRKDANLITKSKSPASDFINQNARSLRQIALNAYDENAAAEKDKNLDNAETVFSLATSSALIVRLDMNEEAVYQITKTFWQNRVEALKNSPSLSAVTPKNAFVIKTLPLHPGAVRFYNEARISMPEPPR